MESGLLVITGVMEPLGNKGQMPKGREIGITITKWILSLKCLGED